MENKKYYYSEEQDEQIVSDVLEDFHSRQEARKAQELAWELDINYMLGNQFSIIGAKGEIATAPKSYAWENREVFNHIAPVVEMRLAKLAKVRPMAAVKPSGKEQSDEYNAKLSKAIIGGVFSSQKLSNLISKACAWSEVVGTCFYKVCWNDSLGNTIAVSDDKEIKAGDVEISVCSPYEIFPDSSSYSEVEDCLSIIHARAYPKQHVKEVYGVDEDGENIDNLVLDRIAQNIGTTGKSNAKKATHVTLENHVLVIEKYVKPTTSLPNGRLTIVVGKSLVYDGDLPYMVAGDSKRGYPFVKQVSSSAIGSFWGTSVVERLIPVQRSYNAIKNRKHEFISRLASGVLAVEDGSVDLDNLEEEGLAPGKILVYRAGADKPEFMHAGTIPKELADEEQNLLAEFNMLGGVSEIMRDSTLPSSVSSGSAISMLISEDETRLSVSAEHIRNCVKEMAEMIIRLYKQFASTQRITEIADEDGEIEVYYWTGSSLTSDDVVLETENELSESMAQRKSMLLELYDKGLLAGEDGKISNYTKNKVLESLGFGGWEDVRDISMLHSKKAIKENLQEGNLSNPLEVDDHELHILEHTRFLISGECEKFSDAHNKSVLEHIKKHKAMLGE